MKYLVNIVIVLSVALMGMLDTTHAAPAVSGPITIIQPDGTELTIRLYGDEFFKYKTTIDHYPIATSASGFYHYASATSQGILITNVVAKNPNQRTSHDKKFLENIIPVTPQYAANLRNKSPMRQDVSRIMTQLTAQTKSGQITHPPKGLIILTQFQDVKFSVPNANSAFNNMINNEGYNVGGATGSAVDYFTDNSLGKYKPTFDVVGPITLPENMAYYGANDSQGNDVKPKEMIVEATKMAVNLGLINIADYDADGDCELDMVFVFFAGYSEAEGGADNAIWPHMWSAADLQQYAGGKLIGLYACTSELKGESGTNMAGIGIFCHEFSHTLGLYDFYDTDGTINGQNEGLGAISLMSSGNYNNAGMTPPYLSALERNILGWLEMSNVEIGETNYMKPIHQNQGYKIPASKPGEFFVLELRDNQKWDRYISKGLNTFGMAVYHVDHSDNVITTGKTAADLWRHNLVNAYSDHQCIRLLNTDGSYNHFNSNSLLTQGSIGNLRDWNQQLITTIVYDITPINNKTIEFQAAESEITLPLLQINKSSSSAELKVVNVENVQNIKYVVNGNQSDSNLVQYGSANEFEVKVIITYTDSSIDIIETIFTR